MQSRETKDGGAMKLVLVDKFDRRCGDCDLCCKLVPVSKRDYPPERVSALVGEMIAQDLARPDEFTGMIANFDKPAGQRCQHQRHGKGCTIYKRRPFACRYWSCRWLTGDDTADLSRPDRSRVVIDLMPDFVTLVDNQTGTRSNIEVVQIWCDPKHPDAWRDPTVRRYIERRAAEGKAAIIRFDDKRAITVFAGPMSQDGQWREVHNGELRPARSEHELIEGLVSCGPVKVE